MANAASRYKITYQLPENLYIESSPVLIEKGGMFFDTIESRYFAIVRIKSLSPKKINAVRIIVQTKTIDKELDSIYEYTYENLSIEIGDSCGGDEAIGFPDIAVKKMGVSVYSVEFEDGDIWKSKERNWQPIFSSPTIREYFNDSYIEEAYFDINGKDAIYIPIERNGIFKCTCGAVNAAGTACTNCHRTFKDLQQYLNPSALANKRIENIVLENEINLVTEDFDNNSKTRENNFRNGYRYQRAICVSVTFSVVVLCLTLLLSTFVVLPQKKKNDAYEVANTKLSEGYFDEAALDFINLKGFKNSKNLAKEAVYKKAESFETSGDLKSAIDCWQGISEYSDSQSRIARANERLGFQNEVTYLNGRVALSDKNFQSAISIFESLGNYRDSDDYKKESKYQYALQLLDSKQYFEAISEFESISDYSDSLQKIEIAKNNYIVENITLPEATTTAVVASAPWSVKVTAVNTTGDNSQTEDYISVYNSFYVFFKLYGGTPGTQTGINYTGYLPNGTSVKGTVNNKMYSGQENFIRFYFANPDAAITGPFILQFFDEFASPIGTCSVNLVGK